ncbi:hypothetical protein Tco_0607535, partial [Tanacetum coccineum]
AAEVEELRKCVSDLEALVAVKSGEVVGLTKQNAGLLERVSAVESDLDRLTSIIGRRWVVRHGFHLAVYKCARSVECRSAL